MYFNARSQVCVGEGFSKEFEVKMGVHQAEFESSQIFNLHIFASGFFGYLLNGKTTCVFLQF